MSIISLKIPERLAAQLEEEARRVGASKSKVVREALTQYFATSPKRELKLLEIVGDLFGSVEGPGDLSTNPKYMEGFGE